MNKNILMVCYYYPPLSDVGAKRSTAFSKYLKKNGWNPYVMSVKNPDKAYCSVGSDRPPEGVHVEYSYSIINLYKILGKLNGALSRLLKPFHIDISENYFFLIFMFPDLFWGWIPLTVIKAFKLIKKFNIDVIYVSCTPYSSAVIGAVLKRLTGKPLIIDFRDPYALNIVLKYFPTLQKFPFRTKVTQFIERKLINYADVFIVNTEETKQAYIKQYHGIADKIFAIHNGFEQENVFKTKLDKFPKFTVIYTGEFYWYALKSIVFFQALALLKRQGTITKDNFQFVFYGDGSDHIKTFASNFGIEELVSAHSRIPYSETLNALSRSHLQLLRIVKPMISTKLFEGIPLNIPFLATIPSGEAEEIIRKYSPSSYVVPEESPEKVADAIVEAMKKYRDGGIKENDVEGFLAQFSRENLAHKLINIIEKRLRS